MLANDMDLHDSIRKNLAAFPLFYSSFQERISIYLVATYIYTLTIFRQKNPPFLLSNIQCQKSHAGGTGNGLLAGAATVGLFKQNGTLAVLNLPYVFVSGAH